MDRTKRRRQRVARASGDVLDKAAALQAMVRAGDISQEEVDFAAYLRHPPSVFCAGDRVTRPSDIRLWAAGLARWGKHRMVQCLIAVCEDCVPLANQQFFWFANQHPELIRLATDWLTSRDPVAERQVRDMLTEMHRLDSVYTVMGYGTASNLASQVIRSLGVCVVGEDVPPPANLEGHQIFLVDHEALCWNSCAAGITMASWLVDRSGTMRQVVHDVPCRAAINHVIRVIRTKVLSDAFKNL